MNLFHSARLKLTGFYFAVLVVFCLLLTFGVRAFTDYELHRSDMARSGAVHQLVERLYDPGADMQPPPSGQYFTRTEQRQSDVTRQNLNRDFFLTDIALLAVGAVLSYWYAGRTLKPIQQAHEDQKRFTADASHELRTPLASMRLENEVFLRQKHFGEKDARELIGSNLEEVGRLERLATNLLSLHRYEQTSLQKSSVAVGDAVNEAIGRMKQIAEAKSCTVTTDLTAAAVLAERESLIELITILLDNAVKYGPTKGTVTVSGSLQENIYRLQVRDHGPGIASGDMPRIFDRMYRGDKARSSKVSGHGLGLSLASQIAEANGAELGVTNHPEGGAVFSVDLLRG